MVKITLTPSNIAIEFTNVSLYHTEKEQLFNNLSFIIPANTCSLLLGPTGSGKTTILNMIKGIIPYLLPKYLTGKIYFFDEEKNSKTYLKQNLDIGFLLQDPELQFIGSTVEQDLAFGLENLALAPNEIYERIKTLEARFPILQIFKHRSPNSLSMGELALIEFLSTIILEPRLMLCDEPLAAMDNPTSSKFLELLKNYAINHTILISTHNIEPFISLAKYVLVIDPQKKSLAFNGQIEDFFSRIDYFPWLDLPLTVKKPL